jgi:hypothetical protein
MNRNSLIFISLCLVSFPLWCIEEEGFKPRGIEQQKTIPELPAMSEPRLSSTPTSSYEAETSPGKVPSERKAHAATSEPQIQRESPDTSLAPLTSNKILQIQQAIPKTLALLEASEALVTDVASQDTLSIMTDIQDLMGDVHERLPSIPTVTKLIQQIGPSKKMNVPTAVIDTLVSLQDSITIMQQDLEKLIAPQRSSIPVDLATSKKLKALNETLTSFDRP